MRFFVKPLFKELGMAKSLDYTTLRDAMTGGAMAFRAVTDLDPAGGEGDKVFPPTYKGGVYAREKRVIDGVEIPCVLLDSVQSQANRLELALLDWHRCSATDKKPFPLVQLDFTGSEANEVGLFTVLEAPHRIADAVFLASEIKEVDKEKPIRFRDPKEPAKGSKIGRIVDDANTRNASGLFGLCPAALIFGMWDSHGARGGLGEKFQRALVSEVFGVGSTEDNRRPASRVDPLLVVAGESLPIRENEDGSWFVVEKGTGNSKLSNVGLGNVTPSLEVPPNRRKEFDSEFNHGGVTIRFARQITVLSLPALRRLHFPIKDKKAEEQVEANAEGRTTLAALALAAVARQWHSGFSLRSRCDLIPRKKLTLELLKPGGIEDFDLSLDAATELLRKAADAAKQAGLSWPTASEGEWNDGCLKLTPSIDLAKAVARSRQLAAQKRD